MTFVNPKTRFLDVQQISKAPPQKQDVVQKNFISDLVIKILILSYYKYFVINQYKLMFQKYTACELHSKPNAQSLIYPE